MRDVTGTTFLGPDLVAKRLQLLGEVVPGLCRVAALWHPHAYSERTMAGVLKEGEAAARTLGLQLQLVPADSPDDIAGAFTAMTRERAEALIVFPSPMLFGEYGRIVSMTANSQLPAMGAAREFVDVGGLMSYGVNLPGLAKQTATYVDKILKGAKPAELPVEQPIKFELVINLKTARELGLTISREFLLVADETWLNEAPRLPHAPRRRGSRVAAGSTRPRARTHLSSRLLVYESARCTALSRAVR